MNKLLAYLYKKIDLIIVFVLIALFNIDVFFSNCYLIRNLNFDSQALLLWQYSAEKGLLPFKDIFYPYGLLTFFRDQNIIVNSVYFFLIPTIFVVFLYVLKKIFNSLVLSYVSFLTSFIVVEYYVGVDSFLRYGIVPVLLLLFSYMIFSKKRSSFFYTLWGIVSGVVYTLFIDQGVYLGICLLFAIFLNYFLANQKTLKIFRSILFFVTGFVLGSAPLLFFLIEKEIIFDFIMQLSFLPNLFLLAKIPFLPSLRSIDNILVLVLLIVSVAYLFASLILSRKKINIKLFSLTNLSFLLVLFEQKNIMRSISKDLFFTGLIILFILVAIFVRKKWHNFAYFACLTLIIIYVCMQSASNETLFFNRVNFHNCTDTNINKLLTKNNDVLGVMEYLVKKGNPKILSTPGDPIFYILLNQKLPYYFSIYEGELNGRQNRTNYAKDNNVEYIVYNTNTLSIQDGIPDYLRAPDEFSYFFVNFIPDKTIGKYMILRKNKNRQDFISSILLENSRLGNYFLNVNFGAIPFSEGRYKGESFKKKKPVLTVSIFSQKENKMRITSQGKILVIAPSVESKTETVIKIKTDNSKTTSISFKPCLVKDICVIDLSKVPLFYNNRIISGLTVNNFQGNLMIYERSDNSTLW